MTQTRSFKSFIKTKFENQLFDAEANMYRLTLIT